MLIIRYKYECRLVFVLCVNFVYICAIQGCPLADVVSNTQANVKDAQKYVDSDG